MNMMARAWESLVLQILDGRGNRAYKLGKCAGRFDAGAACIINIEIDMANEKVSNEDYRKTMLAIKPGNNRLWQLDEAMAAP